VERRSVFHVALVASGAAVLVAVVILVLKVRAAPHEPEVDPGELARAASRAVATPPAPPPAAPALAAGPPPATRFTARDGESPRRPTPQPGAAIADLAAAADPGGQVPDSPRGVAAEPVPPPADPEGAFQDVISEAIRLYDEGDHESARVQAIAALASDPSNQRLLRIATASSCILGEADQARAFYERLSPASQRQMVRRCSRYGIEL
jgi:hypothetical protein